MHVPYSMDDTEPDLYGGLGGHYEVEHYPQPVRKMERMFTEDEVRKIVLKSIEQSRAAYEEGYADGLREAHGNV